MKKRLTHTFTTRVLFAVILTLLTAACGQSRDIRLMWYGRGIDEGYRATYRLFDGKEVLSISAEAGQTLALAYDVEVEKGSLDMRLINPNGETVWSTNLDAAEASSTEVLLENSGRHTLQVVGEDTQGSFEIHWAAQ